MAKQTASGKYYSGTFEFGGIVWDCEVRFDGQWYHHGGYEKCLMIKRGHDYFGDDKFEIVTFEVVGDTLVVNLKYNLCQKEQFVPDGDKQIMVKINKLL